ncbi:CC0125/CC1285 family lipoprotein [Parvularcula dongshanensis]|uniref:DUF4136 domain-containing protein n=1 Tax=Parvularcula dongshanensis TaxID=1173995 RepID=A0A840I2C3_9PROT|nr:hypothetical protein [Parvularcula dongshanensis]MBB4658433.1 hypothetical protein [Parvularcula dongshanensis]
MRPSRLLPVLLLAACASGAAYGPASSPSALGYREQPIEAGRYRVVYRGKSLQVAEDGALRRAAELALADGYDWFTVVSRAAESEGGYRSGPSIGLGAGKGGRSSGVGLGVQLPLGGGGSSETAVSLEVVMGRGERPSDPQTYDANSVASTLQG